MSSVQGRRLECITYEDTERQKESRENVEMNRRESEREERYYRAEMPRPVPEEMSSRRDEMSSEVCESRAEHEWRHN